MKKPIKLINNSGPSEEVEIARGIAADPDTYEATDEEFARMKPLVKPGDRVSPGGDPQADKRAGEPVNPSEDEPRE